ncbi:galectin-4-like [Chaetodon trifascialis]|uniref:galectin-4-like n=1 Tax=Chaetodon trifascialis TaxID=109706 RepID=UPI0039919868
MSFLAPPGYQPIYGPTIPYLGPIFGGLREGSSIYIQGSIPENITRFHVNLLCGESESSDIALHFNPRFDGWDKVVFNTFQNDCWESEERIHNMPFCKGEAFEIVIMATLQGYQIRVNGNDFYNFQHRMPLERVCAMHIGGDVFIQTINVIGGACMGGGMGGGFPGVGMGGGFPGDMGGGMGVGFPGGGMGGGYPGGMGGGMGVGFPGSALPGMGGLPDFNPMVPYSNVIPGGFFPKRTVIIRGMLPFGADRVSINFMMSGSRDIAFHISVRLGEGIVVRNSMFGGSWGSEERELGFNPFMEGQFFDMSVRCGNHRFKVYVNGQHLFNFCHRWRSFNEIDTLEINGDVQISYIHF